MENITEDSSVVELATVAETLTLSFQNIGTIDNLVGFDMLTKLCLDNNFITKIAGISHLKQLRWLDLSFNKIRKIEGLSELKNVEDISLYSNKISEIEGLDECPKLQCLSLGNNEVESLDQAIKLRQLRSLKMVNLTGNPICREPEYKTTILAYVNNLMYLDYALISAQEFSAAREQFHDELLDVEEKESVAAEKDSRDQALSETLAELDSAGIVFAHTLFDSMFSDDSDLERLKHLPGVKDTIEQFRAAFKANSEEFIKTCTDVHVEKVADIAAFEECIAKVRQEDDTESRTIIEDCNRRFKMAMMAFDDQTERHHTVIRLQGELDEVCDELMSIELRQVEKFEVVMDGFDNKMLEYKTQAIERLTTFFRAVEEMEDNFTNGVKAVCLDLIDRLQKEELAEDYLDDEAMSLVMDKDICLQSVTASHDLHVSALLKGEDAGRALEMKRYHDLINQHTDTERQRNRGRILQIHDYARSVKVHLNSYLALDDGDEDEL